MGVGIMGVVLGNPKKKENVLDPTDRLWLLNHTNYKEEELDKMYKAFSADYPRGGMFRTQFAGFFPPGASTVHFCDHVFRTLDTDGNGYLDFKEFIMANDLVAANTPEQKLCWAFKVYDLDNSGAIDKVEMVKVMEAIYSMVDGNIKEARRGGTEEKACRHAEQLFKMIDIDRDGNLTQTEFLRGCLQDDLLMEKLAKIVASSQPPTAYQASYY